MTTSADFTYTKGYLGLLSVLGALLSIIFCCAPYLNPLFTRKRKRAPKTEEQVVQEHTAMTESYHLHKAPNDLEQKTGSRIYAGTGARVDDYLNDRYLRTKLKSLNFHACSMDCLKVKDVCQHIKKGDQNRIDDNLSLNVKIP